MSEKTTGIILVALCKFAMAVLKRFPELHSEVADDVNEVIFMVADSAQIVKNETD